MMLHSSHDLLNDLLIYHVTYRGKSPVVGGRNELDLSRHKLTELPEK